MGDSDTLSVFVMSSLLLNLFLIALNAENLTLQTYDVSNGSNIFRLHCLIRQLSSTYPTQKARKPGGCILAVATIHILGTLLTCHHLLFFFFFLTHVYL